MAEVKKVPKVVTVIITVDLHCCHSVATIKWAVCQLERCFKINSIVFDEKKCTVTVSGPFDPHSFIHQLRCLAGSVIKNVIIEPPQPPSCPPCPGPSWRCCYVLCHPPHQGGCGCQSRCPPWPPAQSQPCGSSPCYKIVCEFDPCSGCSHK